MTTSSPISDPSPQPDSGTLSLSAWSAWLDTPPGRYLLQWERKQLGALVSDVFGYHALQLGMPEINALEENRMPFQCLVVQQSAQIRWEELAGLALHTQWPSMLMPQDGPTPHHLLCPSQMMPTSSEGQAIGQSRNPRRQLVAHFAELPIPAQSMDLVVLPHVLEFADDPHAVLREVERVLRPEGQVVITGLNPLSLWGSRQMTGRLLCAMNGGQRTPGELYLPDARELMRLTRLKDWLKLLGFEVSRGRFGCYRPPFTSQKWLSRWQFMEAAGDRWWPIFGAAYSLAAVKRVRGMRLVGRAWRKKTASLPRLAPAANAHPQNAAQHHTTLAVPMHLSKEKR